MRSGSLFLLAVLLTSSAVVAQPAEDGFVSLFDGKTFRGWYAADMSWWSIQDGAITGTITKEKPCRKNQYIFYEPHEPGGKDLPLYDVRGVMANFELKLTHRILSPHKVNGGFQYRSEHYKDGDCKGYQIDNNTKTPWLARMYDEFGRHTLAWRGERARFDASGKRHVAKIETAPAKAHFALEEWHTYHLVCRGTHMTLSIDGALVAEVFDEQPSAADLSGLFAPQLHSGPPMVVQFKDILYKPLPATKPIPNPVAGAVKPEGKPAMIHTPTMPTPVPDTWLTYHLAHPGPELALDPNPAFFWKGRYHLHYIYRNRSGYVFAHVSSDDMVHWEWRPTVLGPTTTGHGMFSGTGFITKDGRPAMVYHGKRSERNWISYALDDNLDQWSKPHEMTPRDKDGKLMTDMPYFDPDIWINNGIYYGVNGRSSRESAVIMKSDDLKDWDYIGELLHPDFDEEKLGVGRDEDMSCANIFKLGDKWVLLCISHKLGCRYFIGDFKDEQFLPEQHGLMNWSRAEFFAPESLLTPDGRRVMWAWCAARGVRKPISGRLQKGIQSLPRELSLSENGALLIKPLRELTKLRREDKTVADLTVRRGTMHVLKGISGDTMELEIVLEAPSADEFGVKVLADQDGNAGFTISSGKNSKTLNVGYINPPFELQEGEDLTLRIFIDKNMIEVFANDRQAAVAWHEYDPQDLHVSLFSKGGDLKGKNVSAWQMRSIYSSAATEFKRNPQ